eukprot:CAMPEP_0181317864 /NCGR_PEP_ID=MMETSP1101-20121128/16697_1 /TAXON_ID=46948 /ORGANISM="Rhodomonas abbreviata, Strain Caron Lab Isolate" /LENGTH=131 /DNA_ID=CAMNT_0023425289 /DNA_START=14 /DNA_END=409 /DNA_ORIENTATION=+
MQAALDNQKDWNRAYIFDGSAKVLAKFGQISEQDLQVFTTAFNDKDTTFGNGLNVGGANYEVHRFYEEEGLIYGRTHSVDPQEGEGICLARVKQASSGQIVYAVITYRFPILSAKAVPDLQAFLSQHVASQ